MIEKSSDVPAINKLNLIFDLLASEHRGLSQAAICTKLNLPKATVSRLINTLHGMGYLEQDSKEGTYSLGAKLLMLGNIVNQRLNLNTISKPYLEKLSDSISEMVKLSIIRGDLIYPIITIESKKSIRITLDSGTVFPPYIGAAGKVLLSLSSAGQEYKKNVLPFTELKKYTENTVSDLKELYSLLDQIVLDGYSCDKEEESTGIFAIAAPIYDSNSQVIAAVSIPFFGDYEKKKSKYLPLLLNCAQEISRAIGYFHK